MLRVRVSSLGLNAGRRAHEDGGPVGTFTGARDFKLNLCVKGLESNAGTFRGRGLHGELGRATCSMFHGRRAALLRVRAWS